MSVATRSLFLLVFVAGSISSGKPASAQSPGFHNVFLQVAQTASDNGDLIYSLRTLHSGSFRFSSPPGTGTLIAPDGTEFSGLINDIERDSFAEMASLLFGNWTAIEQPGNGPELTYQFSFPAFSLSDVFSEIPVISSPDSGSLVPPEFVVQWAFDQGGMPSSRGYHLSHGSGLELVEAELGMDALYSVALKTRRLTTLPVPITLYVSSQSHVPNVQLLGRPPSLVGHFVNISASFETRSASATYYVIPEPSTLMMALIAQLVFVGRRFQPCETVQELSLPPTN